jgi:hypothetical protein
MILSVMQERNFDKRLDSLRRAGGHASLAARNADEIIASFANGCANLDVIGRQTKYGETRIKNCLKFNLGNGYRLITVRKKTHLILLYVGTHDECDRWLEDNRGHQPEENGDHEIILLAGEVPQDDLAPGEISELRADEYEELLAKKISQKVLKRIFKGLLRQSP